MHGLLRKKGSTKVQEAQFQPIKYHTMRQVKCGVIDRVIIDDKTIIEYTEVRLKDTEVKIMVYHSEYRGLDEVEFYAFETSISEYFSI